MQISTLSNIPSIHPQQETRQTQLEVEIRLRLDIDEMPSQVKVTPRRLHHIRFLPSRTKPSNSNRRIKVNAVCCAFPAAPSAPLRSIT